jgi:hypothetical protein
MYSYARFDDSWNFENLKKKRFPWISGFWAVFLD